MPGIPGKLDNLGLLQILNLKPGDPNTVYTIAGRYVGGSGNQVTFYKSEDEWILLGFYSPG